MSKPTESTAKPLHRSKTILGLLVYLIPDLAGLVGVDLVQIISSIEKVSETIGLILMVIGLRTANQPLDFSLLGKPNRAAGLLLVGLSLSLAALSLSACGSASAPRVTPEGCVLYKVERDGQEYQAGVCLDAEGEVDRAVIQWQAEDGIEFQAMQYRDGRETVIRYRSEAAGPWLAWSSKSGLILGPVPPEIIEEFGEGPPMGARKSVKEPQG